MRFYANDASLHGQFSGATEFLGALSSIMQAKVLLRQHGHALRTTRLLPQRLITKELRFMDFVRNLKEAERRAVLSWAQQDGPFMDDDRIHSEHEIFLHESVLVTDTALAEVTVLTGQGLPARTISFVPSSCSKNPLSVHWTDQSNQERTIEVSNFWENAALADFLATNEPPLRSWPGLHDWATRQCKNLIIAKDATTNLIPRGFIPSAAERAQEILLVLQRLAVEFDKHGTRTPEGNRVYQDNFCRGKTSRFSDSSEAEKDEFRAELTFPHPERPNETLFCPFHGKAHMQQDRLRIHFSWPIVKNQPVYVVYIGPKLTKK